MAPPEKRKPAAGDATGLQDYGQTEDTRFLSDLQASRIRERFPLSWPVARAIAALHYGEARP